MQMPNGFHGSRYSGNESGVLAGMWLWLKKMYPKWSLAKMATKTKTCVALALKFEVSMLVYSSGAC